MKIKSKPNQFNKRYKEFYPTREQWMEMQKVGVFSQAGLYQTMGPHWQHIYWTPTENPKFSRPNTYRKNSK